LIPIYFSKTHIEKLIFHELFVEWLDYKATVVNSPNTIKRHKQHYKKYFEASRLHNMKITGIDELLLEQECNRIVKEFILTRKEWCNVKTILNGMYDNSIEVVEHTKTNRDRFVVLIPKAKAILQKIEKVGEYIFMRDGDRITTIRIATILRKYA